MLLKMTSFGINFDLFLYFALVHNNVELYFFILVISIYSIDVI